MFSPQSHGPWHIVKSPWRSSSLTSLLRNPLMTCPLTLLLPFSMFLPLWVYWVTYFCTTVVSCRKLFFSLSSVFATLTVSSGPGWMEWSSTIHRRGWTLRNYPKIISCPSSTRTTSLEMPAELLNFTCCNLETECIQILRIGIKRLVSFVQLNNCNLLFYVV